MKTKTKTKMLRMLMLCIIFLAQNHLLAQTLPSNSPTQTICVGSLAEPYEVVNVSTSTYTWSMIDQSTGSAPLPGVADITVSANDWYITVDWTVAGIYTLSVMETDVATGCSSTLVDLVVTVEELANAPVVSASPNPICLGDPNPPMSALTGGGTGNSVFNWYADAGLTTLLVANSTTYTDPIGYSAPGSYDYWVTEESQNGCEGLPTQVTVTVTPLPAEPTLLGTPYEACYGLPNPQFTASGVGSQFNWYDVAGNLLLSNSTTYTSTQVNPGTYTYFVEEVVGSCTSLQESFTFIIHAPPAAPSITPLQITICEGETPSDFIVNSGGGGGTYTWYDIDPVANPGATSIGVGSPFTPTQVNPGTYNYYVTESDAITTCVSTSTSATFTINELPEVPVVSPVPAIVCFGDVNTTFTAIQGSGSTGTGDFNWYDVDPTTNPGATPLNATYTSTFTPTPTAVNVYNYWVTEVNSNTNCEGLPLSFTFEIIGLPAAPTMTPNPYEICEGDPIPAFSPIASSGGANLIWYDVDPVANPGATPIGTGSTYTPSIASVPGFYSYWVVDQPASCVSNPLRTDLQINTNPTPGPIWHN